MHVKQIRGLHHISVEKLLTKIDFCLFQSYNLYWWLLLLKRMHQFPENIMQHIPIFFTFSKKVVTKLIALHHIFVWKALIKVKGFHNFHPTESYRWLLLRRMHQIMGNILVPIPSFFRCLNIRFQIAPW